MRTILTVALAVAISGTGFQPVYQAQASRSAEVQLKAAIHKEQVEGDLKGAIELYKKVAAQPGANRAVVAKALVQLGQCYEKLGETQAKEARKAYERVVRDFADQAEPVRVARERIAALQPGGASAARPEMSVRRVWSGRKVDGGGQVSPDGRFLSFTDWETGDLAIHDLATGQNRRITDKGTYATSSEFSENSVVSPDSKQIAYTWYNKDGFYDLRIIATNGGEPRVLYPNKEHLTFIQPMAWSPDGKQILARFQKSDETREWALVATSDGSVRVLKTAGKVPIRGIFSPDGRYLAYDAKGNIFLRDMETGQELPLDQRASDSLLGWAPDGGRILFASSRSGTRDAWLIPVSDGKPQGPAELVKKDFSGSPMGFTRSGAFYFGVSTLAKDVYTAELDLASGKMTSLPQPASRRWVGITWDPDWSPDGRFLAYIIGSRPYVGPVILIRSTETGEERELKPQLGSLSFSLRWFPDGKSLVVSGTNKEGKGGLWRVDAQTGDATFLMPLPPGPGAFVRFDLSPDGESIFYRAHEYGGGDYASLFVRDLQTGRETQLARRKGMSSVSVSPDGRRLLVCAGDEQTKSQVLLVMPAAGGDARELARIDGEESIWHVTPLWTPDGRHILFVKRGRGRATKGNQLWRVPAEGGEPRRLDVTIEYPFWLRLHPDGRRIAIGTWRYGYEVWVLENFLPPPKAAGKQ